MSCQRLIILGNVDETKILNNPDIDEISNRNFTNLIQRNSGVINPTGEPSPNHDIYLKCVTKIRHI